MNETQIEWVKATATSAQTAGHIFPEMAGCEAALESDYGNSTLAKEGFNLFGMKQHAHPIYGNLALPTKEFLGGEWEVVGAMWIKYPSLVECFTDRMATLNRLKGEYLEYQEALDATDALTYVRAVSKRWSTDVDRAGKCIAIFEVCFP